MRELYHKRINNLALYIPTVVSKKKDFPMTTEDLLLEFMAKVNNALSLDDDALRLRAVRQAKHWAEEQYALMQPLPLIELELCANRDTVSEALPG